MIPANHMKSLHPPSRFRHLRYRAARTRLRTPLVWLRHCGLDPQDVFIASYPRSGNTWTRFLLAHVFAGAPTGFDEINKVIPEMGVHGKARPQLPGDGRLIKTHEDYRREYKRAIYLVRDVRDVLLSTYAQERAAALLSDEDFDRYVVSFLRGGMTRWGSWQHHVDSWLGSPLFASGDLLVIRYEDMRQRTDETLSRMLGFLGVTVDPELIRIAIADNSLAKMRDKEKSSKKLGPDVPEGMRFVRKGTVGGWREKLTPAQVALVEQYAGNQLARLGYESGAAIADAGNDELALHTRS